MDQHRWFNGWDSIQEIESEKEEEVAGNDNQFYTKLHTKKKRIRRSQRKYPGLHTNITPFPKWLGFISSLQISKFGKWISS